MGHLIYNFFKEALSDDIIRELVTKQVILKFIYSEKATKFCEISTLLLSVCTVIDKSKVEISQNFCDLLRIYELYLLWCYKNANNPVKGGLISESFSLWIKCSKNVSNDYLEHLLFMWIVLRIVFGTFFWKIWGKVKIFWD